MRDFVALLLVSLALTGTLAGMSLDQSFKQLPTRHKIGLTMYSAYSRASDLGNGVWLYSFFGIGSVLACIALGVVAGRSAELGPALRTAIIVSALLSIAHSLCTAIAAPTIFSQRGVDLADTAGLEQIFNRFAFWQNLRCGLQLANFIALLVATGLAIYALSLLSAKALWMPKGARSRARSRNSQPDGFPAADWLGWVQTAPLSVGTLAGRCTDMTVAKASIVRPYAPDYVDAKTLAYRLSVSESTIEKWEREGKLPRRRDIFGIPRWKWSEVEALVDGRDSVERSKFVERLGA